MGPKQVIAGMAETKAKFTLLNDISPNGELMAFYDVEHGINVTSLASVASGHPLSYARKLKENDHSGPDAGELKSDQGVES